MESVATKNGSRRCRWPEDSWWKSRTIPNHVPDGVIIHNPECVKEYGDTIRPILQRMTEKIVVALDPVSVWLFGSVARGDCDEHSDIDMMIIVADGSDRDAVRLDALNTVADSPLSKDIKVETAERFERLSDDVSSIHWDVARHGLMLYG